MVRGRLEVSVAITRGRRFVKKSLQTFQEDDDKVRSAEPMRLLSQKLMLKNDVKCLALGWGPQIKNVVQEGFLGPHKFKNL